MTWLPRRHVTDDGWTVVYRRSGDGPPLLLLHATLSSSAQLEPLADRLARRFTVIAVDRRGSGETRPPAAVPPGAIDVAVHLDDLAAILESERLGPVLAVGHSYGGCLALELAARRPKLVAGAWVFEPPYGPIGPPSVRAALADIGRRTMKAGDRGGPAAAAEAFLAEVVGREAVAALSTTVLEQVRLSGRSALADAPLLGLDPNGLARVRCPVSLAGGTLSPPFYAQLLTALARMIRGASIDRIGGAGHVAPIGSPCTIAAAVEAFAVRCGWTDDRGHDVADD